MLRSRWGIGLSLFLFTALACGDKKTDKEEASPEVSDEESASTEDKSTEEELSDRTTQFRSISAGSNSTCGVGLSGGLWCWGKFPGDDRERVDVARAARIKLTAPADEVALSASASHGCVRSGRRVACFGDNMYGQVKGTPTPYAGEEKAHLPVFKPVFLEGIDDAVHVAVGGKGSCATRLSGELWCWGSFRDYGEDPGEHQVLRSVTNVNQALHVALSKTHGYVRSAEGAMQRFSVKAGAAYEQVAFPFVSDQVVSAIAVDRFVSQGRVYAWGFDQDGQLGVPPAPKKKKRRWGKKKPTKPKSTPPQVVPELHGIVAVANGHAHTCALDAEGAVFCWGANRFGQLGRGRAGASDHKPVRVESLPAANMIEAGAYHTCVRTRGGQFYCWGGNTYGELGDGTRKDRSVPTRVTIRLH